LHFGEEYYNDYQSSNYEDLAVGELGNNMKNLAPSSQFIKSIRSD